MGGTLSSMARMETEMSGLTDESTNIAAHEERKANDSSLCVKMKRFPSRNWCHIVFADSCGEGAARAICSVNTIAAEKTKVPASSQKQAFSPRSATSVPARAGESVRTT